MAPRVAFGARRRGAARQAAPAGEIAASGLALGLVALLMCASHIRHGGFYYDDWNLVARARFPPAGGLLHALWLDYGQRPGQVLYYAAIDRLAGLSPSPRLALGAAAPGAQGTLL